MIGANTTIVKLAFVRKIKGKGWCVMGHKKNKNGKRRNFGCYPTKRQAKKRLSQIYFFKGRGALDGIVEAADELDRKGMLHLADALMACLESIVSASLNGSNKKIEKDGHGISIRLGKVASLLESKGEDELADKIDSFIPDVVDLESGSMKCGSCPETEIFVRSRRCFIGTTADQMYAMASRILKQWQHGSIDEQSFEYRMMRELRCILKAGFIAPAPTGQDEDIPGGAVNWWEHFENESSRGS